MSILKHPLTYVLVPLCLFVVVASFYRFLIAEDYIVEYEGECDPVYESCFVGCADDECAETYYYTLVTKQAADVHAQCGPDVTDCEEASVCLPDDESCSVLYCSPDTALQDQICDTIDIASVAEPEVIEVEDERGEAPSQEEENDAL